MDLLVCFCSQRAWYVVGLNFVPIELMRNVQAFSIDLSGANCGAYDRNDLLEYNLLNEGRRGPYYGVFRDGADGSRLIKNCRLARASQGLQLAACALAILTMVVTFKLWRAGRVGPLPRAR